MALKHLEQFENSENDSLFNSFILTAFINGIYTLLFFQAIWKLHLKQATRLYVLSLIIAWCAGMTNFFMTWIKYHWAYVLHNASPAFYYVTHPFLSSTLSQIPGWVPYMISDGILIWRCNVLWRNKWLLFSLIFLYVASTGGYVWSFPAGPGDISLSIAILVSATITLFATSLIALKITIMTRGGRAQHSYTKIIEILVESASLTTIVLLLDGILLFISTQQPQPQETDKVSKSLLWIIFNYVEAARVTITGISPVLIAFRVAEETRATHIHSSGRLWSLSRLAFRRSSVRPLGSDSIGFST